MKWKEEELSMIMFIEEKLIWGLETKIETPKIRKMDLGWFDEAVFFTDRRILWDVGKRAPSQIPYDSISAMSTEGPGSGGVAGVKCMAKGGGVINVGSTYEELSIQFPDAESLKYGQWLLNEAPRGTQLTPGSGVPTISGQIDPNAPPQPPQEKSGLCFIATATYGYPMAAEVVTLRSFRDHVLVPRYLGQKFISTYYSFSLPVAKIIEQSTMAKTICRKLLAPIVRVAKWMTPTT